MSSICRACGSDCEVSGDDECEECESDLPRSLALKLAVATATLAWVASLDKKDHVNEDFNMHAMFMSVDDYNRG